MNKTTNNKPKKIELSTEEEIEEQMRLFVNMIIDRVLEERKQGIYRF